MPVGNDIITSDINSSNHMVMYHHDGFSETILSSFTNIPSGLGIAHTDIAMDDEGNLIYGFNFFSTDVYGRRDGFSAVVKDSIVAPGGAPWGCEWSHGSGSDFFSNDRVNNNWYRHDDFSTTILNTTASGRTEQRSIAFNIEPIFSRVHIAFDNGNGGVDQWQLGTFTLLGTITNSVNLNQWGESWDGTNRMAVIQYFSYQIQRYDGFGLTVTITLNEPGPVPRGIAQFVQTPGSAGTRRRRRTAAFRSKCN